MMGKILGATFATALVVVAVAAWSSGGALVVASGPDAVPAVVAPERSILLEDVAATHVLDRDGLARERRLVAAAQDHANARLNCVIDAASPDWTVSLWRAGDGGWRVAFRTVSTLFPADPHVYLIVVDLDDDGEPTGADVLFR